MLAADQMVVKQKKNSVMSLLEASVDRYHGVQRSSSMHYWQTELLVSRHTFSPGSTCIIATVYVYF